MILLSSVGLVMISIFPYIVTIFPNTVNKEVQAELNETEKKYLENIGVTIM